MNRKNRYKYHKEVRAKLTELIYCNNKGRQERLVSELPNVERIYYLDRWNPRCEVILNNGYNFINHGDTCIIQCGIDVYLYWLKNVAALQSI